MVLLDDMSFIKQHSVGFSGVLFALVVVDIHKSDVPTRSVMGFVSVPARWYPWALLVLLQLMIPNVSFLGHFSGILLLDVGIVFLDLVSVCAPLVTQSADARRCRWRRSCYAPCGCGGRWAR